MIMPRCARAESETAAAPDGSGPQKNVDLLVAYLGSSVEIAHDLGCSEHVLTMYDDVVSSVLSECRKLKSPYPSLPTNQAVRVALRRSQPTDQAVRVVLRCDHENEGKLRLENAKIF